MTREIALYEIPKVLEKVIELDDSILPAYNDSFAGWNERARATLGKMQSAKGALVGSSPLMFVHLANSGVLPEGDRLATRQDLEKAIQFYANANNGKNLTAGIYSDVGLALRAARDNYEISEGVKPNDALAKKLTEQLKHKGIPLNKGVLIPFSVLKDSEDKNEYYGLTLDLNELAAKDTIRDLREFNWNWSRNSGLACANRSGRNWDSDIEGLCRSGDFGRVFVVRAEGTPRKF